jgi:osmotically-inducible protein OsmY
MKPKFAGGCATAIFALFLACTNSDQERVREKAAEAKQKARREAERARQELQKLGQQAKREAKKLNENVSEAMRHGEPTARGTAAPDQKLHNAGQELRSAGKQAAVKLDRGAMIAKVKAKLATDVGLSAAASVDVDTNGHVVTLRGTVPAEEKKQEAERAAAEVNGVTKVVNLLEVKP